LNKRIFLKISKIWTPVAVWMTLIFILSTDWFAGPNTLSLLGPLISWLRPGTTMETIQMIHAVLRKLGHWSEYFILASLSAAACTAQWPKQIRRRRFTVTIVIALLYAISDEWHQSFVPTRSANATDVAIDACGAFFGAFWSLRRDRAGTSRDNGQQVAKKP
jgi:VanZ family protein